MICRLTHVTKPSPMIRGVSAGSKHNRRTMCSHLNNSLWEYRSYQYLNACALSHDSSVIWVRIKKLSIRFMGGYIAISYDKSQLLQNGYSQLSLYQTWWIWCNRNCVRIWIVIAPSSLALIAPLKTALSFPLKVSLYAYVGGGKGHDVDKPKILLEYE